MKNISNNFFRNIFLQVRNAHEPVKKKLGLATVLFMRKQLR